MKKTPEKKIQPPSKSNQITVALTDMELECLNHWTKTSLIPKRKLIVRAFRRDAIREGYTFPEEPKDTND